MGDAFDDLKARINNSVKNSLANMSKRDLEDFKKEVKDAIQSGQSPVQGEGRFTDYSKSYKNAINKGRYKEDNKKLRPVNLTLSGEMMKSLYVEKDDEGFKIGFSDKLAYIHTVLGAGKSKVIRKLLPQRGEFFSNSITSNLKKVVSESWIDAFNKNKDKL